MYLSRPRPQARLSSSTNGANNEKSDLWALFDESASEGGAGDELSSTEVHGAAALRASPVAVAALPSLPAMTASTLSSSVLVCVICQDKASEVSQ